MIEIQWIEKVDREWLQRLIRHFAKPGADFELHCWNEETEAIRLAQTIAQPLETNWQHGVYFKGRVTQENLPVLTAVQEGEDATTFFDIVIHDDLWCQHWGTEIIITKSTFADENLKSLVGEIGEKASIAEFIEENQ